MVFILQPKLSEVYSCCRTFSATKIKEAATIAGTAVVGAAGVTSTKVKATWESTKEGWQTSVQPKVAATWQSTKDGWQTNVKPTVEAAAKAAAATKAPMPVGRVVGSATAPSPSPASR